MATMTVVDHEPHDWFLLQAADQLYLDVNCRSVRASFSMLIALTAEEAEAVTKVHSDRCEYLHGQIQTLAEQVQAGGLVEYASRNCSTEWGEDVIDAIARWRYGGNALAAG